MNYFWLGVCGSYLIQLLKKVSLMSARKGCFCFAFLLKVIFQLKFLTSSRSHFQTKKPQKAKSNNNQPTNQKKKKQPKKQKPKKKRQNKRNPKPCPKNTYKEHSKWYMNSAGKLESAVFYFNLWWNPNGSLIWGTMLPKYCFLKDNPG